MGRRDLSIYSLLALFALGGTAFVSGLVAQSSTATPFLVWGGLGTAILSTSLLGRMMINAPKPAVLTGVIVQPDAAGRDFLAPDITPKVLDEKVSGRTSLQIDGITKTYAGKWLRCSGVVSDVSKMGSSYFLQMDCGGPIASVSFDLSMADQMTALNKGDWVEVEGRIRRLQYGVSLEDGVILHVGPPPVKKARASRKVQ